MHSTKYVPTGTRRTSDEDGEGIFISPKTNHPGAACSPQNCRLTNRRELGADLFRIAAGPLRTDSLTVRLSDRWKVDEQWLKFALRYVARVHWIPIPIGKKQ